MALRMGMMGTWWKKGDDNGPALLNVARVLNKYLPRGKGAVPRYIGRVAARAFKDAYISTRRGACLHVEPSSLDVYVHILNHGRTWNLPVFEMCSKHLESGDTFYDVGANIGCMVLEMAVLFRDEVTCVAIEPQPLLAEAIRRSAERSRLRGVRVVEAMVSSMDGEGELFLSSHCIHASQVGRKGWSSKIRRRTVCIDTLAFGGSGISPPSVIKMDIEGGELQALRGARQTLIEHHPFVILECDDNMERWGYGRRDLVRIFSEVGGYDMLLLARDTGELIAVEEELTGREYTELVAVPQ